MLIYQNRFMLPVAMQQPEFFAQWMGLFASILGVEVPDSADLPVSEWPSRPVWKAKKWTLHILRTVSERYGTKVNTERKFHAFSDHYASVWAAPVLQGILQSLMTWVAKKYLPPKVLALHLKYLDAACVLLQFLP